MRKFVFYFSELIISVVGYALLIWYFAKEYPFSSYYREISWAILGLSGIGILMALYHLRNLYLEDRQVSNLFERLENFKIAMNQLLQKKYTLTAEMLANNLRKTVDEYFAVLESSLLKERVYKILNMILTARPIDQDNLSHLLQRKVEMKGSRLKYLAGISFMLGLFGTSLSIVQVLQYTQRTFTIADRITLPAIVAGIKQSMGGLDTIFAPFIVGMIAYFVLGYLTIILRIKQSYMLSQIEEITLEHIMPIMKGFQVEGTRDIPSTAIDVLRTMPGTVTEQLTLALKGILQQTIGGSTENLKTTSVNLQQAAGSIQEAQGMFTEALNAFKQFLTEFEEDSEQLLSSQEVLVSGMKDFSQTIVANRKLSERVEEIIQSSYNAFTQIIQHQEEFLKIGQAEALTYFQRAQEDINALMGKNTEISRGLLESHTMLTGLLHDMKTFILDEQKGLSILSSSLEGTFGEARYQYSQLTEHVEELHKRLNDNRAQLTQVHESVAAIQQYVQKRQ
jgi:tetratricopeptide (TPR) repeat protein